MVNGGDGVGADQLAAGDLYGLEKIGLVFQGRFEQVGDAFGVGVRGEEVAFCRQVATQAFIVFDDAVMDDGD